MKRFNGRKRKEGVVLSDKMNKTIVVKVMRKFRHPIYGKVMQSSSKFKAHDEKNKAKVGDVVSIEETRPLSKDKRWRLLTILKPAHDQAFEASTS
jgi:small subunit ribosomal protein S17